MESPLFLITQRCISKLLVCNHFQPVMKPQRLLLQTLNHIYAFLNQQLFSRACITEDISRHAC